MENIPKELEETQLNLEVVVDPNTKCITMKTHRIETQTTKDAVTDIIPKDPFQEQNDVPDISKMNEMDILIYTERQRILNLKELSKFAAKSKTKDMDSGDREEDARSSGISDIESNQKLTSKKKSKLGMRKIRKLETFDGNDLRKFRSRIVTTKNRLLRQLRNFDNESYLKEITKRSTDKKRLKRMKQKETETSEQRTQRKSVENNINRVAMMRRKAFETPEEMLADKEKRSASREKYWASLTDKERRARQKLYNRRQRFKRNNSEWKKYDMILKGVPLEEREKS